MEVLLVLQVIVVLALIAIILVQKTSSDGFTGGSTPNAFMTGRASANLFTRITSILAAIFIINSLVLAYIASHREKDGSIVEQMVGEQDKEKADKINPAKAGTAVPAEAVPGKVEGADAVPATPESSPVKDDSETEAEEKPAAPKESEEPVKTETPAAPAQSVPTAE